MPDRDGHSMAITINSDAIGCRVVCHEPVGAPCRQTCRQPGCQRDDGIPHLDPDGTTHRIGDLGECNVCLWMNDDESVLIDCHEDVEEPLADGMPIVCTWDGYGYTWRGRPSTMGGQQ